MKMIDILIKMTQGTVFASTLMRIGSKSHIIKS